jgi:hypothetical protein
VSEICTTYGPFAIDPSQLIPEYAQKFQHQTGLGEWPEMLSYLKSFVMQILPSVAATIIGAYIVNHYIVSKPGPDTPAAAVSAAQSKADARNDAKNASKPAKTAGDVASLPEAGVKAKGISEKGLLEKNAAAEKAVVEKPAEKATADKPEEKAADKPAETASVPAEPRRHQPAREKTETREKAEKTAVRVIPLTPAPAQPAAPAPSVAAPASVPSVEAAAAPEERRDANDLARAAIDRLRGGDNAPRTQSAARMQEAPRNPESARVPDAPSPLSSQAVRPLPPPIMVSAPPADAIDPAVSQPRPPYASNARTDDPLRPTPPAEIPTARPPLDLRAEMAPSREKTEKTSVVDDMLSATKSMFQTVLPK